MNNKNKSTFISGLVLQGVLCLILLCSVIFLHNRFSDNDEVTNNNIEVSGKTDINTETNENKENNINTPNNEEIQMPVPEKSKDKIISFIAAGDNIIHENVILDAKEYAEFVPNGKTYNFEPMYSELSEIISAADIAFINQEGPIGGSVLGYSGYPHFNAPDEVGTALVNAGFDIINIANNHVLDKGEQGYKNSIDFWESQPVTLLGGYKSEEDFNTIRYIEKDGIKIALLSYTYTTNSFLPPTSELYVPYYDKTIVDKQSKEARENADVVIVSMHWGTENSFDVNSAQKEYRDILVKNNVDVIIGTHPHVLQPIELSDRPDGKKTLVAYSLGNFLSRQQYTKNMVSGLLSFNIKVSAENNEIYVESPIFTPTVCFYNLNNRRIKVYRFSEFTEEMLKNHGCHQFETPSYSQMIKYVTDTIDKEFLSDDFRKTILKESTSAT